MQSRRQIEEDRTNKLQRQRFLKSYPKTFKRFGYILNLKDGWIGPDSLAPTRFMVEKVLNELLTIPYYLLRKYNKAFVEPVIEPGSDGSILCRWSFLPDTQIELRYTDVAQDRQPDEWFGGVYNGASVMDWWTVSTVKGPKIEIKGPSSWDVVKDIQEYFPEFINEFDL